MNKNKHLIEINNQKINVEYFKTNTEQPTVVFLHEALGSVAQWRDFPQKVNAAIGFNVLVFDRLGHGLSDKLIEKRGKDYLHKEAFETTPSVLNYFGIENPILFGHSDGGTIALLFASQFPTKALITEAAHVLVEDITLKGIQNAINKKDFFIEKLKKYHGNKAKELFEAWSDTWTADMFRDWNIVETILPQISCPSLIIQGESDDYATAQHLDTIVNNMHLNTEKWFVPNCGHTPHQEKEDLVLNKTIDFLNRI